MVSSVLDEEGNPAADADMDARIAGIESQYAESLKTVLGHTSVTLTDSDPETGARARQKLRDQPGRLLRGRVPVYDGR